jgi:hypothetical protein
MPTPAVVRRTTTSGFLPPAPSTSSFKNRSKTGEDTVTIKVKLSDLRRVGIPPELFRQEMRNWRAHMQFVEVEKNFPLIQPDRSAFDDVNSFEKAIERYNAEALQRHTPYPGPHMDTRFTFEVTDDAEPFYQIVNDMN